MEPIGADVQRFLCGSPAGRAVRERAMIMGELIDRMVQCLPCDRKLRVLSVACGHARELFLSESFLQHRVCFTGLDADLKSLQTMTDSFTGFDVTALPWPVKKILNRDNELLSRGQYDLVYSCGLFDYLDDKDFVTAHRNNVPLLAATRWKTRYCKLHGPFHQRLYGGVHGLEFNLSRYA